MDLTWMGEPSLLIKLNLKELVETVMVTVMIVIVDLVVTVAVTMVVVVRRVEEVVGIASSVVNLDTLLESAQMGMVGEVTDMVAGSPEMIGMVVVVVMDLTVAVTDLTVVMTVMTVVVTALTGVVTDILVAAVMVEVGVTVVTVLVPIDGLDLEKCVSSRYENPIYYQDVCFLVLETL